MKKAILLMLTAAMVACTSAPWNNYATVNDKTYSIKYAYYEDDVFYFTDKPLEDIQNDDYPYLMIQIEVDGSEVEELNGWYCTGEYETKIGGLTSKRGLGLNFVNEGSYTQYSVSIKNQKLEFKLKDMLCQYVEAYTKEEALATKSPRLCSLTIQYYDEYITY